MFTHFFGHDVSVTISRLMLLSVVAILPFVGGCGEDDNPIVDDHDEAETHRHADADGFALEVDGAEVYRQLQGTDSGGLTVGAGKEIEVHVAFLDASGAEIHVGEAEEDEHGDDEEETFTLGLSDYDPAVIGIHLSEDGEEHAEDEHGDAEQWRFEVVGLKVGTTKIRLQLLHGDHPDFTAALLIPVTVQ
jgi:hypothetical protein